MLFSSNLGLILRIILRFSLTKSIGFVVYTCEQRCARKKYLLIVWGFTLVGHFMTCLREREKMIEEIVHEIKERDKEERRTGMKVKKQKK